ncbi:hypothetical protein DNF11_2980 [Malassezia restricta CBS 7877]|uniref:Uncharacterized protein n=2 Tax=Malassezia restricta TaxID=76775 RepID=A0A3G2S7T8_MALR7|nr:hypothetical protein DNF11_2980 [Malassezia restricta CBS 7877]
MSLYRRGLRLIRTKPEASRFDFTLYLRHFFRHPHMGGGLSVRDFATIEYMMRRASRMMEDVYENPSTKRIALSPAVRQEMHDLGLSSWRRGRP